MVGTAGDVETPGSARVVIDAAGIEPIEYGLLVPLAVRALGPLLLLVLRLLLLLAAARQALTDRVCARWMRTK